MSEFEDGPEALDHQIQRLEESMSGAATMASTFQAELRGMQDSMLYTGREVSSMSRSIGGGLRRAFDGLVFDGMRLSDALVVRNDVRYPELCGTDDSHRIREVGRHHADDLIASGGARLRAALQILDGNRPADDPRVGAKAAPPQAVAQNDHSVSTWDFVSGGELTADCRPDPERLEEPGRDPLRDERLRFGSRFAQREPAARNRRDGFEHLLVRRPVEVVLRRNGAKRLRIPAPRENPPGRPRGLTHCHEPLRLIEGQATQHDGIHHRHRPQHCVCVVS